MFGDISTSHSTIRIEKEPMMEKGGGSRRVYKVYITPNMIHLLKKAINGTSGLDYFYNYYTGQSSSSGAKSIGSMFSLKPSILILRRRLSDSLEASNHPKSLRIGESWA